MSLSVLIRGVVSSCIVVVSNQDFSNHNSLSEAYAVWYPCWLIAWLCGKNTPHTRNVVNMILTFDCLRFRPFRNFHWLLWRLASKFYSKIHVSSPVMHLNQSHYVCLDIIVHLNQSPSRVSGHYRTSEPESSRVSGHYRASEPESSRVSGHYRASEPESSRVSGHYRASEPESSRVSGHYRASEPESSRVSGHYRASEPESSRVSGSDAR